MRASPLRRCLPWAVAAGLLLGVAPPVEAQRGSGSPFRARSLQVSAAVAGLTGTDFGAARATLTGNETPPTPYTLFETESTLGPAPGVEARIGYMLTRTFAVEGALFYTRPRLETRVSGDTEGAAPVTAFDDIWQYMVDVSAVLHLERLRFGANGIPFVLGGGGYLRQLYDDRLLVETGRTVHAGGGIKYVLRQRPRGFVRGVAVRADARLYVRTGGIELDDDTSRRIFGAGSAGLTVLF